MFIASTNVINQKQIYEFAIMNNKQIGNLGEIYAADYFKKYGYTILAKNYTTKYGEIDLIVRQQKMIIFVEVKTRKNDFFGTAGQAVNHKKQQKIIHTAQLYIAQHQNPSISYRFDIIEIYYSFSDRYRLNHIKGAFEI